MKEPCDICAYRVKKKKKEVLLFNTVEVGKWEEDLLGTVFDNWIIN